MNSASTRTPPPNRRTRSRLRSFVTALQAIILLAMGACVGVGLGLFVNLSKMLPTVVDFEAPEATVIYSSDGVVLGRVYIEDRTNVPLKDMREYVREATVAIEDRRFYQHSGVDPKGIARAAWQNVRGQRLAQGGSTITQQLARNVYLTPKKTLQRKVREAALAVLIERSFTKDRILELYLNQVYYGSGAYGVQAASKVYFGKNVDQLTLSESALLAGLTQKPSAYSPHEHKQVALDRRDVVLNRMAELGYLTPAERDKAKKEDITIVPRKRGRSTYKAPHFLDYVTRQLRERYGNDVVTAGGLRVYTTLNYEMQKIAEKALREQIGKQPKYRRVGEGCFVCIEPASGYVRAMVGSVDPKSQFNRCTQAIRQPGSSFKLFVYTAALEAGMKPTDRELNRRTRYPDGKGGYWRPKNYDGKYGGSVTLKTAVAKSINLPAIRIADKVGITNVINYAHAMGITAELKPYLPLAIGGIRGVHPIEMASAYGTFANEGIYVPPCAIIRVTNSRGETIEDFIPEGEKVVSERTVRMMDEMLRAVVTSGTGWRMNDIPQARGKTGTTNEDKDAWWIGYIPGKLVAAVWVGNDDNSPMRSAWGGTVCGPVWSEFMRKAIPIYDKAHKGRKAKQVSKGTSSKTRVERAKPRDQEKAEPEESVEPDVNTVEDEGAEVVTRRVCDESGLLATVSCPSTHKAQFARGHEPTSHCTIHGSPEPAKKPETHVDRPDVTFVSVTVCTESGMLAGAGCPKTARKRMPIDEVPTQVCTKHRLTDNR